MPPAIPDRWTAYKPCGKIIDGTRIICFKVPLRRNVQQGNNEINYIWDIPTLLRDVPKLGAVIDLTNTARYYNPRDLQEAGVLHKKILMPGRVIPPENKVIEFMDTVDEFLGKDCEFEKGRGYQIERENYLADLLGQKLPPPDLGQSTEVKPIGMNYNMYRSPFGEYERNDYQSNEWYVRREGKFRTRKRISRWDAYEDSRRKRQRNDSSSSNRSYDYKYDY
ncbi:RNA/RNP complex-1-interacting phosphatase isoform X2 [Achroia grisella]|uniref:RNA/RNP complex-1-interacting phosphatase isoform X2 n=1 Tax=Achroia grisella TaxID=688607 RepID=UPI0027D2A491|nr:RNA/RNP complex-1-interacting phosphatase isoform X2 [Achroia grisella]